MQAIQTTRRPPAAAPTSNYRILAQARPARAWRWLLWLAVAAWAGTLVLAWRTASEQAAPGLSDLSEDHARLRTEHAVASAELAALRQREANLARSDQVSRDANAALQDTLADSEARIAGLRRELAFYERLAGGAATGGLRVHTAEFTREAAGTWRYRLVLSQGKRRTGKSAGTVRFAIDGVRDGRMASVDWNALHQAASVAAQPFAFRYFQSLTGSVMLPDGFTPQRVRVQLRGENESREQTLAWDAVVVEDMQRGDR
ncbi:membrane protein [Luteimonas pelagia]